MISPLSLALALLPSIILGSSTDPHSLCHEALGGHPLGHPQVTDAQVCAYRKCFSLTHYGDIFQWKPDCTGRTLRRHTAQGGGFLNTVTKTLNAGWQSVSSALPSISIREIQRQSKLTAANRAISRERSRRKDESHPIQVDTPKGNFSLPGHTFPAALERAIVGASLVRDFTLTTLAGGNGEIPSTSNRGGDFLITFDLSGFRGGNPNASMTDFRCYGQFLPENSSGQAIEQAQIDCFKDEGTPSEVSITDMVFSLDELGITMEEEAAVDDSQRHSGQMNPMDTNGSGETPEPRHETQGR